MARSSLVCSIWQRYDFIPNIWCYQPEKSADPVTVIENNKAAKALEELGGELETDDGRYYFFEYRNAGTEQVYKGGHTDVNGITYAEKPVIFVDEPYAANAVALLKMAGFIVSRKHKYSGSKYLSCYDVTLT